MRGRPKRAVAAGLGRRGRWWRGAQPKSTRGRSETWETAHQVKGGGDPRARVHLSRYFRRVLRFEVAHVAQGSSVPIECATSVCQFSVPVRAPSPVPAIPMISAQAAAKKPGPRSAARAQHTTLRISAPNIAEIAGKVNLIFWRACPSAG